MRYPSFALLIAGLLFAGCSSLLDRHEIAGSWELSEAAIEAGTIAPEGTDITSDELSFPAILDFTRGSRLFGRTCNSFSGIYAVSTEGRLIIPDWLQSVVGCGAEGSPDDIVDQAFTGLGTHSPVEFDLVADSLIISYDGVRLEFRRAE